MYASSSHSDCDAADTNGAIGVGCKETDLDVSRSVFKQLAEIDQGRVLMEWSWLENSPVGVS